MNSFDSLILQIHWPEDYPDVVPELSLDSFHNQHIPLEVKKTILSELDTYAKDLLGSALTSPLIDYLKQIYPEHIKQFSGPEKHSNSEVDESIPIVKSRENVESKTGKTDAHLTKAQKRKLLSRTGQDGKLIRGHDWVDVARHLQQTGSSI